MDTPGPLSYTILGKQRIRWQFTYLVRMRPARYVLSYMCGLFSLTVSAANIALRPRGDTMLGVGLVVLALCVVGVFARLAYQFRRVDRAAVTFESRGIDCNVNDTKDHLTWYGVAGAAVFDDVVAIERRDGRWPIFIPTAAAPDPKALWTFLAKRLEGDDAATYARYALPARGRLTNRVDQFLIDHATA